MLLKQDSTFCADLEEQIGSKILFDRLSRYYFSPYECASDWDCELSFRSYRRRAIQEYCIFLLINLHGFRRSELSRLLKISKLRIATMEKRALRRFNRYAARLSGKFK